MSFYMSYEALKQLSNLRYSLIDLTDDSSPNYDGSDVKCFKSSTISLNNVACNEEQRNNMAQSYLCNLTDEAGSMKQLNSMVQSQSSFDLTDEADSVKTLNNMVQSYIDLTDEAGTVKQLNLMVQSQSSVDLTDEADSVKQLNNMVQSSVNLTDEAGAAKELNNMVQSQSFVDLTDEVGATKQLNNMIKSSVNLTDEAGAAKELNNMVQSQSSVDLTDEADSVKQLNNMVQSSVNLTDEAGAAKELNNMVQSQSSVDLTDEVGAAKQLNNMVQSSVNQTDEAGAAKELNNMVQSQSSVDLTEEVGTAKQLNSLLPPSMVLTDNDLTYSGDLNKDNKENYTPPPPTQSTMMNEVQQNHNIRLDSTSLPTMRHDTTTIPTNSKPNWRKDPKNHYCELCQVYCGVDENSFLAHSTGKRHKKNEKKPTAFKPPYLRYVQTYCKLCKVNCADLNSYNDHLEGAKHRKKVQCQPITPKKLLELENWADFLTRTSNNSVHRTDKPVSSAKVFPRPYPHRKRWSLECNSSRAVSSDFRDRPRTSSYRDKPHRRQRNNDYKSTYPIEYVPTVNKSDGSTDPSFKPSSRSYSHLDEESKSKKPGDSNRQTSPYRDKPDRRHRIDDNKSTCRIEYIPTDNKPDGSTDPSFKPSSRSYSHLKKNSKSEKPRDSNKKSHESYKSKDKGSSCHKRDGRTQYDHKLIRSSSNLRSSYDKLDKTRGKRTTYLSRDDQDKKKEDIKKSRRQSIEFCSKVHESHKDQVINDPFRVNRGNKSQSDDSNNKHEVINDPFRVNRENKSQSDDSSNKHQVINEPFRVNRENKSQSDDSNNKDQVINDPFRVNRENKIQSDDSNNKDQVINDPFRVNRGNKSQSDDSNNKDQVTNDTFRVSRENKIQSDDSNKKDQVINDPFRVNRENKSQSDDSNKKDQPCSSQQDENKNPKNENDKLSREQSSSFNIGDESNKIKCQSQTCFSQDKREHGLKKNYAKLSRRLSGDCCRPSLRDRCRSMLRFNNKVSLLSGRKSLSDEACDDKSIVSVEEEFNFRSKLQALLQLLNKRRNSASRVRNSNNNTPEVVKKPLSLSVNVNDLTEPNSVSKEAPSLNVPKDKTNASDIPVSLQNSTEIPSSNVSKFNKISSRTSVNLHSSENLKKVPNNVAKHLNDTEVKTNSSFFSDDSSNLVKSKCVPKEVSNFNVTEVANDASSLPFNFNSSVKSNSLPNTEFLLNTCEDKKNPSRPSVNCSALVDSNGFSTNDSEVNNDSTNLSVNYDDWVKSNSVPKTSSKSSCLPLNTKKLATKESSAVKENLHLIEGLIFSKSQSENPESFDEAKENLAFTNKKQNCNILKTGESSGAASLFSDSFPKISVLPVEKINQLSESAQKNEPRAELAIPGQFLALEQCDESTKISTNEAPFSISTAQVPSVEAALMCSECLKWTSSDRVHWCECRLSCDLCCEKLSDKLCDLCDTKFEADSRLTNLHRRLADTIPHPCPYSPCDQSVQPGSAHELTCRYVPTSCVKCGDLVPKALIGNHLDRLHPNKTLSDRNKDVRFEDFSRVKEPGDRLEIYCFTHGMSVTITLNKVRGEWSFMLCVVEPGEVPYNIFVTFEFKLNSYSLKEKAKIGNYSELILSIVKIPSEVYTDWKTGKCKLDINFCVKRTLLENQSSKRKKTEERIVSANFTN